MIARLPHKHAIIAVLCIIIISLTVALALPAITGASSPPQSPITLPATPQIPNNVIGGVVGNITQIWGNMTQKLGNITCGNITQIWGNMTQKWGNITCGNITQIWGNMTQKWGNITQILGNITKILGNIPVTVPPGFGDGTLRLGQLPVGMSTLPQGLQGALSNLNLGNLGGLWGAWGQNGKP
jgi:uncharacterized protein YjbJ (UPF0337 family)